MDFGALPPEVNSARMYSGPGPGSLLAAAGAWDVIADELYAAAGSCSAVVSALTGQAWLGAGSASMAAAAAPYLSWMNVTAAQAQYTAAQARAAALAFETALAATVPPPVIAANRVVLASLIATNVMGINIPAIAATEAHYGEMWAQDAAAMYGYAAASAAASTLTPFTSPAEITNPAGLNSVVSPELQQLAQPLESVSSPVSDYASAISSSISVMSSLSSVVEPLGTSGTLASTPVGADVESLVSALGSAALRPGPFLAGPGSAISAELGKAASVGSLSVPQSWAAAAIAPSPLAAPAGAGGIPVVHAGGTGGALGGLPVASPAARAGSGGGSPQGAQSTPGTRYLSTAFFVPRLGVAEPVAGG